ncbi:MAG: hypothetical protein RIR96_1516 [Bacteroidota bacterium]|jgi:protein SCO1/2
MPHSKALLWMILTPNKGKTGNTSGNKAQWIAQITEVTTPNPSQFIRKRMAPKVHFCNKVAKTFYNPHLLHIACLLLHFNLKLMMKNKKLLIYLGFFTLLLTVFYFAIREERPFQEVKLAVINNKMPEFEFTDQNGKKFGTGDTEGKIYVAEYFFTTCKGICPKMNTNMRRVYDLFKDREDFMILSHTCMPEVDSVPLMKAYENKMLTGEIKEKNDGSFSFIPATDSVATPPNKIWKFLTGSKEELYQMARQGYMIDNGKPDSTQIKDQFIHTQFFALVDRYGRVRGIYDGLVEAEIQKLFKDIPLLMEEKIEPARFMNGFSNNPE